MPYVHNHGVKIHYETEGAGAPLVLVPGFLGSSEDWRYFGYADVLRKDYRLVLVDPRGRGHSDRPADPASYDPAAMLGDVLAVMDALQITKAHYFGYSMGAMVGWRIPLLAPDRFYSLVLGGYGWSAGGSPQMNNRVVSAIRDGLQMALRMMPAQPMEFFVAALEKSQPVPFTAARKTQLLSLDVQALLTSFEGLAGSSLPAPEEVLPKVTLRCLLFAGEADPYFESVRNCAALMPNATLFSLPGLDHNQAFMRQDLVLPQVRRFLTTATLSTQRIV